jgi:hypothetical protein
VELVVLSLSCDFYASTDYSEWCLTVRTEQVSVGVLYTKTRGPGPSSRSNLRNLLLKLKQSAIASAMPYPWVRHISGLHQLRLRSFQLVADAKLHAGNVRALHKPAVSGTKDSGNQMRNLLKNIRMSRVRVLIR